MFLAIDIGNTNVSVGVFEGDRILAHGKLGTDPSRSAEGYTQALREVLGGIPLSLNDGMIGSVVRGMAGKLAEAAGGLAGIVPREARAEMDLGIRVAVPHPARVGIDRLLSAAAAFDSGGGPVIVADLGTAATVDLVSGEGTYLGGAIAPGVRLSLDTLHLKTSLLPRIDLSAPASVLGRTTPDAILAGVVFGTCGMVEGLVRRISGEAGGPCRTLLTGGDAAFLSPLLAVPHDLDPHLVLRGLLLAHRRNPA